MGVHGYIAFCVERTCVLVASIYPREPAWAGAFDLIEDGTFLT